MCHLPHLLQLRHQEERSPEWLRPVPVRTLAPMQDFLLNAHSGWQYVTLVAVIVAIFVATRSGEHWERSSPAYSIAAVAVDIQVTLGIILWIADSGWSESFLQAWVHPVAGLAALAVVHIYLGRARRAGDETSHGTVRTGLLIALALVIVAVALGELA